VACAALEKRLATNAAFPPSVARLRAGLRHDVRALRDCFVLAASFTDGARVAATA
jgi:hypothetical protein